MENVMSTPMLEKKEVKRGIFQIKPCTDADGNKWEMHRVRTAKHQYFHTQKEALAAAHVAAGTKPAHVVLYAKDGHIYREFDLN